MATKTEKDESYIHIGRDFPVKKIREDFPILKELINDKPLVYLDNAATTQKPKAVIDAINDYYQHYNSNIHRSIHALGEKATEAYETTRDKVRHFIHAQKREEIIFTSGATEGINLVAQSFLLPRIQAGEEILLTYLEHHSNIVPWQVVCQKTGAIIKAVPINVQGELDLAAFSELLTPNTKFFAVGHISNALGTINPIKDLIAASHDNDTLVLIDGSQAGPHLDINVQDLDCDFYVFSGHKMYGPTGAGVLYGKAEILDGMAPYQTGGEMISHVSFDITDYKSLPYKFEAGTPPIAAVIGLGAAIDYLQSIGLSNIYAYEKYLNDYAMEQLWLVKGIGILGNALEKTGIIAFNLANIHAHDVGTILNSLGIAIRAGHHCAMPLMDFLGVEATARASFAFYNTREEVHALVDALNQVEEVFGG